VLRARGPEVPLHRFRRWIDVELDHVDEARN
jgi:hypothetical protein